MIALLILSLGLGFALGRINTPATVPALIQLPPQELRQITQYWLRHDDSTAALLSLPLGHFRRLSSAFGWRRDPFSGHLSRHEGLDFSARSGTPILAAGCGVVRRSHFHSTYGYLIDIDHGLGLVTRYAHARSLLVQAGQFVNRGQTIAHVGSTGASTGPHLHFEVHKNNRPLDPRSFLSVNLLGSPLSGESVF
jgi:murein DD-endopeptidase MepM/ murein hydrolase activator NlpD